MLQGTSMHVLGCRLLTAAVQGFRSVNRLDKPAVRPAEAMFFCWPKTVGTAGQLPFSIQLLQQGSAQAARGLAREAWAASKPYFAVLSALAQQCSLLTQSEVLPGVGPPFAL